MQILIQERWSQIKLSLRRVGDHSFSTYAII